MKVVRDALFEHLKQVAGGGGDAIDNAFLRSIEHLQTVRDTDGHVALLREAGGRLIAALTMIRVEFGHDAVRDVLDVAGANERLGQRDLRLQLCSAERIAAQSEGAL